MRWQRKRARRGRRINKQISGFFFKNISKIFSKIFFRTKGQPKRKEMTHFWGAADSDEGEMTAFSFCSTSFGVFCFFSGCCGCCSSSSFSSSFSSSSFASELFRVDLPLFFSDDADDADPLHLNICYRKWCKGWNTRGWWTIGNNEKKKVLTRHPSWPRQPLLLQVALLVSQQLVFYWFWMSGP